MKKCARYHLKSAIHFFINISIITPPVAREIQVLQIQQGRRVVLL